MADKAQTKVVINQTLLTGARSNFCQRVAMVYIDGMEYRVSAPSAATGKALDWFQQFTVTQLVDINSEVEVTDARAILALRLVKETLEGKTDHRSTGRHPDGMHCSAQICLKGHRQHSDGMPFEPNVFCNTCGSPCIDLCPRCEEPIRGNKIYSPYYDRPLYCHGCGRPYPWLEERLNIARDLLNHDDKLSLDEREKLWSLLKDVMSDPKSDLAPAKKKLIEINVASASAAVREFALDLIAKTAAEMMKPI